MAAPATDPTTSAVAVASAAAAALKDVDWLGFDLDHTLVRYRLDPLCDLVFRCLARYLVEQAGYPPLLLEAKYDRAHALKGVVFDTLRGNLLTISAEKTVIKAMHGHRFLERAEIDLMYGSDEEFSAACTVLLNGQKSPRLFPFLTFFDMPGASLCGLMVDLIDKDPSVVPHTTSEKPYGAVVSDLLGGFDFNFKFQNFAQSRGWYFPEVRAHTEL